MDDLRTSNLSLLATATLFDAKNSDDITKKNWNQLPSVFSMRLSEWIAALTHPKSGLFPNGISPKQLHRLSLNQIAHASQECGREVKPVWKSSNHLGVMLWNEVKAGRVVRLHKACYIGATFADHQDLGKRTDDKSMISDTIESVKNRVLSKPERLIQLEFQPKNLSSQHQSKANVMESSNPSLEFQCQVCKRGLDESGINGVLKCIGCVFESHVNCAYPDKNVPTNIVKRLASAISVWRCYDCKCCHLCGGKDDANDGLLLCDGCDSGEHMGCQNPPSQDVPPAPWFCSLCRNGMSPQSAPSPVSPQKIGHIRPSESSPFGTAPLVIDEPTESDEKAAITVIESVSSPDCSSSQSEIELNGTQVQPPTVPSLPNWSHPVKASPPISDDTPEFADKRRFSEVSVVSTMAEEKPIRTRLGKRVADGKWVVDGQELAAAPPRCKRRRTQKRATAVDQSACQNLIFDTAKEKGSRSNSTSSQDNIPKFGSGSRRSRKEKEEPDLLPFMSEDLPLLNDEDTKCIQGAKLWSVDDTSAFMDRMGFADSAKAFAREEIDGAALLLLRRQDVLLNLGLKLGPALKTYKFVRYIQSAIRSV